MQSAKHGAYGGTASPHTARLAMLSPAAASWDQVMTLGARRRMMVEMAPCATTGMSGVRNTPLVPSSSSFRPMELGEG